MWLQKIERGTKMKKHCETLQLHELQDMLWFMQVSLKLKEQSCVQLADLFEKVADHKLKCAMHLQELPSMNVESILREACYKLESDYQMVYQGCDIDEKQEKAIQSHRKYLYLKLVDLLHDCVQQEKLEAYQCISCGYQSNQLDEYCPICHCNQAYFMKQD